MNSNEITGAMEIDTNAPIVTSVTPNALWVNENSVGTNMFYLDLVISEDASTANTPVLSITTADVENSLTENTENSEWISADTYRFSFNVLDIDAEIADIDLEITNVLDSALNIADSYNLENVFSLDTKAPEVIFANINATEISEVQTGNNFVVSASFSEPMLDQEQIVSFNPITPETLTETLNLWTTETSNETTFLISDEDEELTTAIILEGSMDLAGNQLIPYTIEEEIWIDNRQPAATYTANVYDITSTGGASFIISAEYDESINPDFIPTISFPVEDPELQLEFNASQSIWTDSTYTFVFDVEDISPLGFIDIEIEGTHDIIDNVSAPFVNVDFFSIMLDTFLVVNELSFNELKVYPNPAYAGEDVTLEIKSPETYSYKLLDALGREVELPELSISAGAVNFDSSNFSSGTYFLSVFKEGERKAIRFEIIK